MKNNKTAILKKYSGFALKKVYICKKKNLKNIKDTAL
jgi:hypothetical protein